MRMLLCTLAITLAFPLAAARADQTPAQAKAEPATEAAEALDLGAVSELFKESSDLEVFERKLNDPKTGINNLDLDDDGKIDYLRVVAQVEGSTHLIVVQACLGDDDYQDVSTIEVEREGDECNLQVHGDVLIYGPNFYLRPAVRVAAWPIVVWMYRPGYHPYVSAVRWGHYPRWWRATHPVARRTYRARTVQLTRRGSFTVTRIAHVKSVHRVKYAPRHSTRVKTTKITVRKGPRRTVVKKKTVKRKAHRR